MVREAVTVTFPLAFLGEADQLRAAVDMVLTKIAEDPQSGTCPTISYSHAQGPVASAYPTGSPFAYTIPPPPHPTSQAQTFLPSHPPTAAIVRQKNDGGGIPVSGAYYHNALQATYFAAAAAAAAADYQHRLVAAGYQQQQQQHRGSEAAPSGEASGASSSLESAGGGCGFVGPLTPSSGEQDTASSSFYTTPLIQANQVILQSPGTATSFALFQSSPIATGAVYAPTTGLESPLDSPAFPLIASSPPPPPSSTFGGGCSGGGGGGGGAVAGAFFSPLRATSPISTSAPVTSTTATWLRSRGFSEEAVAEITHAMSTLSAHGVLNVGTLVAPESMILAPPPHSTDSSLQAPQTSSPKEKNETETKKAVEPGGEGTSGLHFLPN